MSVCSLGKNDDILRLGIVFQTLIFRVWLSNLVCFDPFTVSDVLLDNFCLGVAKKLNRNYVEVRFVAHCLLQNSYKN